MDTPSLLILIFTAVVFGYCGGREHGFRKLMEWLGIK